MNTNTCVLNVRNLRKIFQTKQQFVAVDDISFAVQAGEIVGLLGPNGAGKSTTIQMLLGAVTPTSGSIRYFGQEFAPDRSKALDRVGYVNGYGRLPRNLTARENLEVHGRLYRIPSAERKDRIDKLLKFFGVYELRDKTVGKLSAGQSTRIMLARAFLPRPELVLLDEPTAALDPDICCEVRAFVQEQRRKYDVSMIYTSHNMSEVSEICDRVIFLNHGRIIAEDTPENLAAQTSLSTLRLTAGRAVSQLRNLLLKQRYTPNSCGEWLEVDLEHQQIGSVLFEIAREGIQCSGIEIRKPSLEDYFLKMSEKRRNYEHTSG